MDPLQFELKFLENTDKHGFLTTPATTANIQDGAVTQAKLASGVSAITVCTSSTKPASPFTGQVIYMSDTDEMAIWDSSAWEGLNRSKDRNVIINGAMQVHQRGTSVASITASSYNTADRYRVAISSLGTWTQSVEADAPTGSGFRKSLKMLCTTADASPAAPDVVRIDQLLEGQNLQQFAKGTSSAKQFSLSFWVKSNVTGTYIAELSDVDNTRQVSASYTVSASATWEKKTITFPADTTGAFDNDNAESLQVRWWLGAGTDFTSGTLNTSWASSTNANRAVGQTNLASATNNYWQITGVQLEAGAVATPFEFEDYGVTLAKCFRYFQRIVNGADQTNEIVLNAQATGTNAAYGFKAFLAPMRSSPSITTSSAGHFDAKSAAGVSQTGTSLTFTVASPRGCLVNIGVASGLVAGDSSLILSNSASSTINASSEL